GGIRLHAASGAAAALIELIDLERECCAWVQFAVTRDPIAGEADVVLNAEGEGEAVLAGMFVAGEGSLESVPRYGCRCWFMLSRAHSAPSRLSKRTTSA